MEFETIDYRNSDTEDLKKKLRDKNTPTSMSKERIVLAVDEALAANKEAVDQFSTLTQPIVDNLKELETETGLSLIPQDADCNSLISAIQAAVINSDRVSQFGLNDVAEDREIMISDYTDRIYIQQFGSLERPKTGSPERENFEPVLPLDLKTELLKQCRVFDAFLADVPGKQIWREYISLKKGKITASKDAVTAITERLTTYATEAQAKAFKALQSLIVEAQKVEKDHGLPEGFVLEAIQHDNKYFIYNQKILTL